MFNEALLNVELVAANTAAQQTADNFSATLTQGASVAVVGIGIVFLILALLWGVLELFKLFFYVLPNRKAAKTEVAPSAVASQPAVTEAPVPQTDNGALIAAITAAITAYRAEKGTTGSYAGGFRVVSFKRK